MKKQLRPDWEVYLIKFPLSYQHEQGYRLEIKMDKKELLTRLNGTTKEINNLRANLNRLDKEKETWFDKKESLKEEISKFVKEIKEIKYGKDNANITIKDLRDQRDEHNEKIKELITKIKELNKNKIDFIKKNKVKFNPAEIKRGIEDIEYRIETEVLSIEKEKSLMRKIKELKKVYKQNIGLKTIIDEIDKIDKEIEEHRKRSDDLHKEIKNIVDSNDPGYMKFKEYSNKINNLREEQKNAFNRFTSLKDEVSKVNDELRRRLDESYSIKKQLDDINKNIKLENQRKKEAQLEEEERLIEQKLMTKKKLTKEDLILLQR